MSVGAVRGSGLAVGSASAADLGGAAGSLGSGLVGPVSAVSGSRATAASVFGSVAVAPDSAGLEPAVSGPGGAPGRRGRSWGGGTVAFHRPARTFGPEVPEQRVSLPSPPARPPKSQNSQWIFSALPLISGVSVSAYLIAAGRVWLVFVGVGFVVLSIGLTIWVRTQYRRQNRENVQAQRERYLNYLDELHEQAQRSAAIQRLAAAFGYPSPVRLWGLAVGLRRVWERRPSDEDFLRLRLGSGQGQPALRLELPRRNDVMSEFDAQAQWAAQELVESFAAVGKQPAWVDVANLGVLSVVGSPARTGEVLAALLLGLSVLHAPDDVRLVVLTNGAESRLGWVKWLPHTQIPELSGRVPAVSDSWEGLVDVLAGWLVRATKERGERSGLGGRRDGPPSCRLVVVLERFHPDAVWARDEVMEQLLAEAGPFSGVHVVCAVGKEREEPSRAEVSVRVDAGGALALLSRNERLVSPVVDALVDAPAPGLCEHTARVLFPLRLSGEREQVLARSIALPDMLGVGDVARVDPSGFWRGPDDEALLRLPLGLTGEGEPLVLDLKEAAMGGYGPHGLIVGATGSGKSELLRTLVTGLTMTHAPEQLSFVLVDFKGGATFAGVTELPHVAGLITNLADDLALVDRMRAALIGEQQRRQQLLRDAGDVDTVREYQLAVAAGMTDTQGRPLEPMPHLLIIVDEFGELLSQRSDFTELFVQIGRVGRSLGMHLLLATQRLEEGRLRGLESHLSYRICLRTFSPAESRTVIGTADAYHLPSIPGSAYLKVDESMYERFRVAHVSGVYQEPDQAAGPVVAVAQPEPFGLRTPGDVVRPQARESENPLTLARPKPGQRSEMQVAVERIKTFGAAVHQVWLPPLPPAIELDALVSPLSVSPARGWHSGQWPHGGQLIFPVGVVDLPTQQQQRALLLDLSGKFGHLVVVGAPQSGKSTLLRTAMLGAMLTHTPEELQFIGVDFGGGSLVGLAGAPHVRGVATRHDQARARRGLAVARQLIEQREALFSAMRIDSPAEFRRRRAAGELPEATVAADVLLVIDNWAAVRASFEEADEIVHDVATRGLGVGVHLVLTANRWGELRPALRDNIPGRLELRLGDPAESEIARPVARQLRTAPAGRGVVAPGHIFHTALPRLDGESGTDNLTAAQQAAVAQLAAGWGGAPAPQLRVLGDLVTPAELDTACAEQLDGGIAALPGLAVPIGLRETDLAPAVFDLAGDGPHLLVLGDSGMGKTGFLRSWMRALARRRSAWDIRFVLIDYRRGLLDAVPGDYLGAVATDQDAAAAYLTQIIAKLKERMPPPEVTPAQLRERSWWTGPEIIVVVDDYDLVAGPGLGNNPLSGLNPYLTQATDLGFHLILARRVGGAARSLLSDPLVSRIRELGSSGLILPGDPREGVLLADQRARPGPPGRATLITRQHRTRVIQTVHDNTDHSADNQP